MKEALKLALEAIYSGKVQKAAGILEKALAQPEQEPVAEVVMAAKPPNASPAWLPFKIMHAPLEWRDSVPVGTNLYTSTPPQRTWVGLTNSEWQAIVEDNSLDTIGAIKIAIEAKLKEKNT